MQCMFLRIFLVVKVHHVHVNVDTFSVQKLGRVLLNCETCAELVGLTAILKPEKPLC